MTAPEPQLPPACAQGCVDADYWRDQAFEARTALDAPAPSGEPPAYLLPDPPMPGDLLAYEDGPDPMSVGDRVMALAVLGPWCWAVWGWSVGVVAHELVKVVRGR